MICSSNTRSARLNAFQRLMLQWGELHPYNAAHVYRLARPLAPEALVAAIRDTYRANGLGIVEVDAENLSYCHQTDHSPQIEIVDGGLNPEATLADHLTKELNHRFARPRCQPWRFSVVDAEPDAHYLIATYDHWIADGVAARLMLRNVLDRYCQWNVPENRRPLDLYPGTYREVFAHRFQGTRLLGAGVRSLQNWWQSRTVARVPYSSSLQMEVCYELYRAAGGTVPQLRHFARSLGATVHDVILAALGRAMAEYLPCRAARRQQSMALGTIVDTRGEAEEDLSDSMGAFLGYFLVRLAADRSLSLADTVRCVAAATGPIKARRAYLDALIGMKMAGALWPRLRASSKPFFMRNALPITAGVSNVVVRDPWMEEGRGDCITEYIRGVSTGPILPVVLTPTSFDDEMNVGVCYRIAGFSRQKINGLMAMFMDQIEHPAGVRQSRGRRRQDVARVLAPVVQEQPLLLAAG
jgi:hypothetical protein